MSRGIVGQQPAASNMQLSGALPFYPNDAAARAAGLQDWQLYRSIAGVQQLQGQQQTQSNT